MFACFFHRVRERERERCYNSMNEKPLCVWYFHVKCVGVKIEKRKFVFLNVIELFQAFLPSPAAATAALPLERNETSKQTKQHS